MPEKVEQNIPLANTDDSNQNWNENGVPAEIADMLHDLPEPSRRQIISMFSMQSSMIRSPENDVAKKLTPEHLNKMLEIDYANMEKSYQDKKESRTMYLIVFILSIIFIGFVIVFLKNDKDLLEKLITILVSGGFGVFGGYGLGKSRRDD